MRALSIDDGPAPAGLAVAAARVRGDVDGALRLARTLDGEPHPGDGKTARLWSVLATIAAVDLTVARVVEPHLDALAILAEAGVTDAAETEGTWGVYAAERPGMRLDAVETAAGVVLDGAKPWCSLADRLDRALVTAHVGAERQLFAVDLHATGVTVATDEWHARGLSDVTSGSVRFDRVPARPVGEPGWYRRRPGFAWGGIGVAACWYGGAAAVADALVAAAARREPDQLALAAIGRADRVLHSARTAIADAASRVDAGVAVRSAGAMLAARVRGIVAAVVDEVLLTAAHALGPAPLTLDEDHARRVADLGVYVRQHHAERDDAALGRDVLASGEPAW